jgi:hypothetical protein
MENDKTIVSDPVIKSNFLNWLKSVNAEKNTIHIQESEIIFLTKTLVEKSTHKEFV